MSALPPALERAVTHTAAALTGVEWLVCGSTARALSGFAATPRDLDIEVAAADIAAAAAALGLEANEANDARARSLRATGTIGDVEIDLSAGLTLMGPGGILPADFELMAAYATEVVVAGVAVRVAPVEEQIVRILISGNEERRRRFVTETPAGFVARGDYVERRFDAARAAR